MARRGITLLEVLISIGVLSVGILGIASLLPVASFYTNDATKYDRASTVAQQAYHDLLIRGYLSSHKWVDPQGAFTYHNYSAVVVDPLGLGNAWLQQPVPNPMPVYFPAFPNNGVNPPASNAPILYRASVESGDTWPDSLPFPPSSIYPVLLPYQMASRIFRSNDDLVFQLPTDTDMRPASVGNVLSPDFEGEYSWMFTASHTPQDIANANNMQRYQVSIVVFRNRDLTLWANGLDGETPPPERLVYADFIQPPLANVPFYAGGSLNLWVQEPTTGAGAAGVPGRSWLENIKPNTYLMLMVNFVDTAALAANPSSPGNYLPYPRLAWYRIVNVGDGPNLVSTSPNTWSRSVTITGADWPAMTYNYGAVSGTLWNSAAVSPLNSSAATLFCVLVNDAVAVYEDVITLDNSLLRD